ncbi:ragulator complex protein LAMTOR3-B-like [Sycon ciliatum]|uniref:ragulator complex protein LAMTOR3-B-like n=1 Tax=Sycon ciliatum TaxID=27933 RepID=UPI0020A9E910|eukprot:scpid107482/ scgid21761/ Ragulator complex protein LAMTOR3-B; Late endosomal/lysosomal adaptor and MAPK and MTOR activator 3-B; Mitogen-activated protein kinase scaffold protein 1
MADDIEVALKKLISGVDGLEGIVISDRDGVPVAKVLNGDVPEAASRPGFLATFSMATEQASKLGLGANKSLICFYDNCQVVHLNFTPLVATLLARVDANTGVLLGMSAQLNESVQQLSDYI